MIFEENKEEAEEFTITCSQKIILLFEAYLEGITLKNISLTNETKLIVKTLIKILRCVM